MGFACSNLCKASPHVHIKDLCHSFETCLRRYVLIFWLALAPRTASDKFRIAIVRGVFYDSEHEVHPVVSQHRGALKWRPVLALQDVDAERASNLVVWRLLLWAGGTNGRPGDANERLTFRLLYHVIVPWWAQKSLAEVVNDTICADNGDWRSVHADRTIDNIHCSLEVPLLPARVPAKGGHPSPPKWR